MKVVLLAGGLGSRITEESRYRPKPMVELGGMPILWHIMREFFWNDRFVFKGKNNDLKSKLSRLVRTYVSYGGTSILAIALLWTQINLLGVPKTIAPLTNLLITVPLNFLINKLWAFK